MQVPAAGHAATGGAWWLPLLISVMSPSAAAQPVGDAAWRCDGMIVSAVHIEQQPPTLIHESAPEWARPFLGVILQHQTTRASAVRPFLLLDAGEPCSEFERAESERLLRAQPYLADATVLVIPDTVGGARVEVTTVDEIPLVIGARVRDGRLAGLKYGSSNASGAGLYGAAEWREGFSYRDGFGGRFINHHAFATRTRFLVELERAPVSTRVSLALQRPLLTSAQRVAWLAGVSDGSDYATFARPGRRPLALAVDRSRADIGGTVRIGPETRRLFAGSYVTHDRLDPATAPVVITDTGFVGAADPRLAGRYGALRRTRLAAVAGARLLSFTKVRGFDALLGSQDVARGIQLAAVAGQSFSPQGNGRVLGLDFYAGAGNPRWFAALHGQWEGEKRQADGWVDAVASGRIAWYRRLSAGRMLTASGEFAGAWNQRLPYQLPLGDDGGVRGYRDAGLVGARRAVARAEHRWVPRRQIRFAAVGAAAFIDVGGVWAGDVPFGVNSGLRTSAGIGVLAAAPQQSRRTFRVDLAVPLIGSGGRSYELRVSTLTPLRMLRGTPATISSLRTILPPPGIAGLP